MTRLDGKRSEDGPYLLFEVYIPVVVVNMEAVSESSCRVSGAAVCKWCMVGALLSYAHVKKKTWFCSTGVALCAVAHMLLSCDMYVVCA